jgi:DNA-binding MarR family transcriptional regulator
MENQDIRNLKILEEIDNDRAPTQRDLSKKLNISLGLVNLFIKRLGKKGYFKIKAIPKNRVKYILTPKGAAEKSRLTYKYIQFSFDFYKKTRKELQKLLNDLMDQGVEQIVFWGASDLAEIACISLQETTISLVAVVDDEKIGDNFLGFGIKNSKMLNSIVFDRILITSTDSQDKAMEAILKQGVHYSKVVILESPK